MKSEPFIILVSDRDATVGMVSAMLLSSALSTERTTFDAKVRVLIEPEIVNGLEAPEMPEEIRKIEQAAISASSFEIEHANLIVAFSGMDLVKINQLREIGIAAPAVNLCQFVNNLKWVTDNPSNSPVDVREVIAGAALQFGFGGGSSECAICADKAGDNRHYWINIADTCSKFAQLIKKFQS